jgi:hypothetical protein
MTTDDETRNFDLSCTFCGPGTWATWEVVTDECLVFACERHHAELSQAKIIQLERMRGKESWNEFPDVRRILCEEEYPDDLTDYD